MKPVIVIGGGGHAKVIVSTLVKIGHPVLGFTDPDESRDTLLGLPRLGNDDSILSRDSSEVVLVNGVGCIQPSPLRETVFMRFKKLGYTFLTVIHPDASVAIETEIGEGTVIFAGAVIQAGTRIGENTIINTRASIDHDSNVGSHVHVAPGATLSGSVILGNGCHIGVGATILQGITIGPDALVGAGSVVLRDVKQGIRIFGNPARTVPV